MLCIINIVIEYIFIYMYIYISFFKHKADTNVDTIVTTNTGFTN